MPQSNQIVVSGAREHNLKDISLELPRDALVVITGLSGSGKSSLAFDTIYAEGQRRYVESLSAYARQFLGQMDKPDVDSIEGLSPAISIDQKTTSRNPRSTVGTVTEIYDYLRLLWSRVGKPHCPICGRPIVGQSAEQIIDQVMELAEGTRFMVLAPVVRGRKGEYGKLLEELRADGFARVKIDDRVRMLEESIVLDKRYKHDISVVVDRLVMRHDVRKRLADSIETAVALADGLVEVEIVGLRPVGPPRMAGEGDAGEATKAAEGARRREGPARGGGADRSGRGAASRGRCSRSQSASRAPSTGRRWWSSSRGSSRSTRPHGACERCTGLGSQMEIDPELVVPDPSLSIAEGALAPWANSSSNYYEQMTEAIAELLRRRPRSAVGGPDRGAARGVPVRHQRRAGAGHLPQPLRAPALLRGELRGDRQEPRAPLPRDRLGVDAREDRGVHVAARHARCAAARGCARSRARCWWRARGSRTSARCRRAGRWSGWRRSSCRRPTGTSRG